MDSEHQSPGAMEEQSRLLRLPRILGFGEERLSALEAAPPPEPVLAREGFSLAMPEEPPIEGEVRSITGGRTIPVAILCPGPEGGCDWGFIPFLAETLLRSGIAVVTFNGPALNRILQALLEGELPGFRSLDLSRIGVWGYDRMGAVALRAAAKSLRISSVCTWATPSEGLQEAEAALSVSHLIVHGLADESVPPEEAKILYAAGSLDGVEIVWVPGADHAFGTPQPMTGPASTALALAVAATREFFADTLG